MQWLYFGGQFLFGVSFIDSFAVFFVVCCFVLFFALFTRFTRIVLHDFSTNKDQKMFFFRQSRWLLDISAAPV